MTHSILIIDDDEELTVPNVCEHFEVDCTNLEEFMEREKRRF